MYYFFSFSLSSNQRISYRFSVHFQVFICPHFSHFALLRIPLVPICLYMSFPPFSESPTLKAKEELIDMNSFATYGLNDTCTDIIRTNSPAEYFWNITASSCVSSWPVLLQLDMGFPLPTSPVFARSIMHPLYHLVITGLDSKENMAVLLGPSWETDARRPHLICRLLALMDPKPGSVAFCAAKVFVDAARSQGFPEIKPAWNPRVATEAEGVLLRRFKWERSILGFTSAPAPPVEF